MTTPIVKRYGQDFCSLGPAYSPALTLPPSAVTENDKLKEGIQSRTHPSGWTISGELHEDYCVWVNEFEAVHPQHGRVWGNFEQEVKADSEDGFQHFWKNHEPEAWDYGDI